MAKVLSLLLIPAGLVVIYVPLAGGSSIPNLFLSGCVLIGAGVVGFAIADKRSAKSG